MKSSDDSLMSCATSPQRDRRNQRRITLWGFSWALSFVAISLEIKKGWLPFGMTLAGVIGNALLRHRDRSGVSPLPAGNRRAAAQDRGGGARPRVRGRHGRRADVLAACGERRRVGDGLRLRLLRDDDHLFRGRPDRPPEILVKNRLKVLRAERDWTQADLAQRLEVSRQTVNAIEKGKYDPSLPLAFRISRLFQTSIEAIFDPEKGE